MTDKSSSDRDRPASVKSEWGKAPDDQFGYASEEERHAKRGLEDWELVDKIPDSQRGVPWWFLAVIAVVLVVAVGLSFPFWGDRPGFERSWVNWGFLAAIGYLVGAGIFVYIMVNMYGSGMAGRLDSDKSADKNPSAKKGRQQPK